MTATSLPAFAGPARLAIRATSAASARWERWIPPWVRALATAVWVTAPGGRIVYVNERAERALGVAARDCVGRTCHDAIALRTAAGAAFCGPRCPLVAAAEGGAQVEPADVRAPGRCGGDGHWLQMTVIPVEGPDRGGRWMVHVARVADRERRLEQYVGRVAGRSAALRDTGGGGRQPLSPRERDVLDLLVADVEPGRIAARLGLSRVTVRNHVQHVLAKMGAHSVAEAVAMRLLEDSGAHVRSA